MFKVLSLIVLFVIQSYAQDVIPVSRGSAIYGYTPTSITSTPSDNQIIWNFASIKTRTTNLSLGTSSAVTRRVLYGINAITDSVSGYSKVLSTVTEDTIYLSKGSLYWLSKDLTPHYLISAQDTVWSILSPSYNLAITTIGGFFALEWQCNSNRELRFIIQQDTSGGSSWADYDTVGINIHSYNDSLTTNGTYKYRVCAERTNRSTYSNTSEATLTTVIVPADTTAPNPVTSFIATGYLNAGSSYVIGNWTGSNSEDVDYYKISKDSGNVYVTGDSIAAINFGINTFTDTLPGVDETWSYLIQTVDDSGNVSWINPSDSAKVPAAPLPPPPNAPSLLVGIGDSLAIHLTWQDNSSNEDSFYIYRNNAIVYRLAANVEAKTDTPLANNTSYSFQVSAKNAYGESAKSNTVNVTTSDTTSQGEYVYGADAHFVSLNGQGSKNGTYGNDWDYPTITWASMSAGDTLFFDGGSSGVIYPTGFTVGSSGSPAGLFVIRPRWDSGHNGEVTFNLGGSGTAITVGTRDYIRLEKLSIREVGTGVSYIAGSNVNYMDSLDIRQWKTYGYYCNNSGTNYNDSLSIRWTTMILHDSINGQVDGTQMKYISDFTMDGCYVLLDNRDYVLDSGEPGHSDCIQWFDAAQNCVIKNSIIMNLAGADTSLYTAMTDLHHQTFMTEQSSGTMIVYNCVIMQPYGYGATSNFAVKDDATSTAHWIFIHNTFVTRRSIVNLRFKDLATVIKNNIFYAIEYPRNLLQFATGTGSRAACLQAQDGVTSWTQFDGNLFSTYAVNSTNNDVVRGSSTDFSMAQIFGAGGEQTGNYTTRDRVNPLFVNFDISTPIWQAGDLDALDLGVQTGSPAINNGANLQTFIESLGLIWINNNCGATLPSYIPRN